MRLHAYVLAADATWLRTSVARYYDQVDRIVVSYDEASLGWTGSPVDVATCRQALRDLDHADKLVWLSGSYHHYASAPTRGDTEQRSDALARAADGADWVLQIDTDEVLPSIEPLLDALETAEGLGLDAVEWPMRVLYRHLGGGRFLEVRGPAGEPHFEYPGPIAVRGGVHLVDCRRTAGPFLRATVRGDTTSLQVARPEDAGEHRVPIVGIDEAVWHNSWGRPPADVRRKIGSWGHSQGWRSRRYYWTRWLPAPLTWRTARNLHPFAGGLWPRLGVVDRLPFPVHASER